MDIPTGRAARRGVGFPMESGAAHAGNLGQRVPNVARGAAQEGRGDQVGRRSGTAGDRGGQRPHKYTV